MRPRRTSTRLVLAAAALGVRAASTALPADALRLASSLYMLSSPPQLVALVTGGGTQLAPWLLATPGASNSILEFSVPYAKASLAAVLGHDPPQSVNAAVAESMAERAYERSVALGGGERSVGLGCTAALRSEPMRRGEHRCYIAVRSAAGVHCLALTLAKGARSREAEDAVVARAALATLARACGVDPPPLPGGGPFWKLAAAVLEATPATPPWPDHARASDDPLAAPEVAARLDAEHAVETFVAT